MKEMRVKKRSKEEIKKRRKGKRRRREGNYKEREGRHKGRKSYSLSFVASGSLSQIICCRTLVVLLPI